MTTYSMEAARHLPFGNGNCLVVPLSLIDTDDSLWTTLRVYRERKVHGSERLSIWTLDVWLLRVAPDLLCRVREHSLLELSQGRLVDLLVRVPVALEVVPEVASALATAANELDAESWIAIGRNLNTRSVRARAAHTDAVKLADQVESRGWERVLRAMRDGLGQTLKIPASEILLRLVGGVSAFDRRSDALYRALRTARKYSVRRPVIEARGCSCGGAGITPATDSVSHEL